MLGSAKPKILKFLLDQHNATRPTSELEALLIKKSRLAIKNRKEQQKADWLLW